jgi:beta-fructofuranosidase
MHRVAPWALVAAAGLLPAAAEPGPQDEPERYQPPGMWAWDFWFAESEGTYHAFYLEAPQCLPDPALMHGHQHIGHATSTDLRHWTNLGPALVPVHGTWNDWNLATGSVVRHDGRWWMLFTGGGTAAHGLGLAVSDDLMRWSKVGDGPVMATDRTYEAPWGEGTLTVRLLADPYVYPEAADGWYIAVVNAQEEGGDEGRRGCLVAMRSRDLLAWEPWRVLAYPRWFERMETPQLFHREGGWYLYFGAHGDLQSEAMRAEAPAEAVECANFVFRADSIEGPFEPRGKWWLALPEGGWFYIAKVLRAPDGSDALLATLDQRLSPPYAVRYAADGSLTLLPPEPQEANP